MTEINAIEFFTKLCVTFLPLGLGYLWIVTTTRNGFKGLFAGIDLEKQAILDGRIKIQECQNNNWAVNSRQVQGYSAVTVAAVLLFVAITIQKTLNVWSKAYTDVIILVAGLSSLAYAFSLQYWNCAIDRSPDAKWSLLQRGAATALQSIGWHGLYVSVILAVSYASTLCGLFISLLGMIGLVLIMRMKAPNRMWSKEDWKIWAKDHGDDAEKRDGDVMQDHSTSDQQSPKM
jgi:hypothetical protein